MGAMGKRQAAGSTRYFTAFIPALEPVNIPRLAASRQGHANEINDLLYRSYFWFLPN
jgi:hypothetical protein